MYLTVLTFLLAIISFLELQLHLLYNLLDWQPKIVLISVGFWSFSCSLSQLSVHFEGAINCFGPQ